LYGKQCGSQNIDEIHLEDVIDDLKMEKGQETKLPCVQCGRKLKFLGQGIFDG
jgi:hypothetical protein